LSARITISVPLDVAREIGRLSGEELLTPGQWLRREVTLAVRTVVADRLRSPAAEVQ
jgi:hypothetical protein